MKIRKEIAAYVPMADMLLATFGEDVEVVLHDLADPEHSVVYVAGNVGKVLTILFTRRLFRDMTARITWQIIFSRQIMAREYVLHRYLYAMKWADQPVRCV